MVVTLTLIASAEVVPWIPVVVMHLQVVKSKVDDSPERDYLDSPERDYRSQNCDPLLPCPVVAVASQKCLLVSAVFQVALDRRLMVVSVASLAALNCLAACRVLHTLSDLSKCVH